MMTAADASLRRRSLMALLAAAALSIPVASAADAPLLSLPIACEPGKTCFIQSYVDIDPGPGVLDFACGSATYEGHKGTDFRVLSIKAAEPGIAVLASADGTVKGVRDEMEDALVRDTGADSVKDRECGNGAVVDHGGGWETQYCHMRRGSVAVKSGDKVTRGQKLGNVGYSGLADFAHVHLEVRHDGKPIDPFSAREQTGACLKNILEARGLWDEAAARAFSYLNGQIIGLGFTSAVPNHDTLERDDGLPRAQRTGEQLVFYARLINLRQGDEIRLDVAGPEGFLVENKTTPLDRAKATFTLFAGKRLTKPSWPTGIYRGTAMVIRKGEVVLQKSGEMELR